MLLDLRRCHQLRQHFINTILIFIKTGAQMRILLLCNQENGEKINESVLSNFFLFLYCLVITHFFFQVLSAGVSFKTSEIYWCRLNHSIRDVNCYKGIHVAVLQWLTQIHSSIYFCLTHVMCWGPWADLAGSRRWPCRCVCAVHGLHTSCCWAGTGLKAPLLTRTKQLGETVMLLWCGFVLDSATRCRQGQSGK